MPFIFILSDFRSDFKGQNYNKKSIPKSKTEKIFENLKFIRNQIWKMAGILLFFWRKQLRKRPPPRCQQVVQPLLVFFGHFRQTHLLHKHRILF